MNGSTCERKVRRTWVQERERLKNNVCATKHSGRTVSLKIILYLGRHRGSQFLSFFSLVEIFEKKKGKILL